MPLKLTCVVTLALSLQTAIMLFTGASLDAQLRTIDTQIRLLEMVNASQRSAILQSIDRVDRKLQDVSQSLLGVSHFPAPP